MPSNSIPERSTVEGYNTALAVRLCNTYQQANRIKKRIRSGRIFYLSNKPFDLTEIPIATERRIYKQLGRVILAINAVADNDHKLTVCCYCFRLYYADSFDYVKHTDDNIVALNTRLCGRPWHMAAIDAAVCYWPQAGYMSDKW